MERKGSTGSGILVEREITVHSSDEDKNGVNETPKRPYVSTLVRSMSDLRLERGTPTTPSRTEPSSAVEGPSPLQLVNMHRHPDVDEDHLGELLGARRSEESLRHLVEFLRTAPPPGNFMSQPDYSSSSEDNRWARFRVFHKAKKQRRKRGRHGRARPPVIQLPDSAVAAKTIGGHRHIAISIPFEYSHLGPISASQYPIFESMTADFHREIEARLRALSGLTYDRIGTRLNPVAEDRESLTSVSLSPKTGARRSPRRSTSPPQIEQRPASSKGKEVDKRLSQQSGKGTAGGVDTRKSYHSTKSRYSEQRLSQQSAKSRRSQEIAEAGQGDEEGTLDAGERVWFTQDPGSVKPRYEGTASRKAVAKAHSRNTSQISTTSSIGSFAKQHQQEQPRQTQKKRPVSLPVRSSSKKTGEASEPAGQLLTVQSFSDNGNLSSNGNQSDTRRPRGSIAGSIVSTESVPRIMNAQTARAYQNIPIVVQPTPQQENVEAEAQPAGSPLNLNFPKPPTTSGVSRSVQTSPTRLPERSRMRQLAEQQSESERPRSRKERVREMKMRDLEKLKQGTSAKTEEPVKQHDLLAPPKQAIEPESPILGRFSRELTSPVPSRPHSMPVGPLSSSTAGPSSSSKKKKPEPIQVMPEASTSAKAKMPILSPTAILEKSYRRLSRSGTTTPLSSPGSGATSPIAAAAAALGGLDRTSLSRRKERQAEREAHQARKERYVAKALAEEKETTDRLSRQELVLRYENLKEVRVHEMERRLRRLERNGEVWLRSMVPLMDSMNRLLQEQYVIQRNANYAYPAVPRSPAAAAAAPSTTLHHVHTHVHAPRERRRRDRSPRHVPSSSTPSSRSRAEERREQRRRARSLERRQHYEHSQQSQSHGEPSGSRRPQSSAAGDNLNVSVIEAAAAAAATAAPSSVVTPPPTVISSTTTTPGPAGASRANKRRPPSLIIENPNTQLSPSRSEAHPSTVPEEYEGEAAGQSTPPIGAMMAELRVASRPSPLQEEFEREVEARRVHDERQDRLDARMRQAEKAIAQMQRKGIGRRSRQYLTAASHESGGSSSGQLSPLSPTASSPLSNSSSGDGSFELDGDDDRYYNKRLSRLEAVEPVMRELRHNALRLTAQHRGSGVAAPAVV